MSGSPGRGMRHHPPGRYVRSMGIQITAIVGAVATALGVAGVAFARDRLRLGRRFR